MSAIFGITWMFVGNIVLGFNSIYISTMGFLLIGIFILLLRHDLFKDALFSGIFVGVLMLIFYLIFCNIFDGIIQKW